MTTYEDDYLVFDKNYDSITTDTLLTADKDLLDSIVNLIDLPSNKHYDTINNSYCRYYTTGSHLLEYTLKHVSIFPLPVILSAIKLILERTKERADYSLIIYSSLCLNNGYCTFFKCDDYFLYL